MTSVLKIAATDVKSVERRVAGYDWNLIGSELNSFGCAVLQKAVDAE
jgi:hypothetical protein